MYDAVGQFTSDVTRTHSRFQAPAWECYSRGKPLVVGQEAEPPLLHSLPEIRNETITDLLFFVSNKQKILKYQSVLRFFPRTG
ncbi:hypothetical protein DP116_18535 [Brasilonema bromeliae SPC951]|uniref:Uncharacterized protein n=1 Tax=Brasilonema bromeliae SPC951 TaxID=385972 RepID=A0ABX1PC34_9CYAN|nr:hypothetical protein [Brasilonema bromeliae SPC951]